MSTTIADILARLEASLPTPPPVPADLGVSPPVSPPPPWVDPDRIRVSLAPDYLARLERGLGDDRPSWERSADATRVRATQPARPRFTFGAPKAAVAKPRPKRERSDETRRYFREYQRRRRAEAKANASGLAESLTSL